MKLNIRHTILGLGVACLTTGTLTAAETTNSAAPAMSFASFRIIAERNIFNATRSGQAPRRGKTERVVKTESIKLLGTMSYEKGRFAIFGGSSSQFQKMLQTAEAIAIYKIADIGPSSVKLTTTNGQVIDLAVGMQLKRQENGPWSVSGRAEPTTATVSAAAEPSSAPSSGAENDVLKRLMQKREQELNK